METMPTAPATAIFIVNQLGVLIAGYVAFRMESSEIKQLFLITGFAGGFTTFSSISVIAQASSFASATGFIAISLIASLAIIYFIKPKNPA